MFTRSLLITLPVLSVLVAPLFFHHSPEPAVGPYDFAYLVLLLLVVSLALSLALLVSRSAARLKSLAPALLCISLLGVLIILAASAELILSVTLRGRDTFDVYRQWGHKKSLIFGFEAQPENSWTAAQATYTTDRYGFRTHRGRQPWEQAEGPRIFVLGGSSTFGFGLGDDETWAHLLEVELQQRLQTRDVSVVNAGNNGFNSLQVLLKYYLRVSQHAPTHILFYGGNNDFQPYRMPPDGIWISEDILHTPSIPQYWSARTRGQTPYARTLIAYALSVALGRSSGFDPGPLDRQPPSPLEPFPAQQATAQRPSDVITHNGRHFIRNLRSLCLLARAEGVTPILTTFIHGLSPGYPRGRASNHYNELVRSLAREEDVMLIDIAKEFFADSPRKGFFYPDGYHPRKIGAAFISSRIAPALAELLRSEALHPDAGPQTRRPATPQN
jgi:lysophospholipase L1-like esterase